jgi:hypothetical protein
MERLRDTSVEDVVRHSRGVQQEIIMSRRIDVREGHFLGETHLRP